MNRWQYTLIEFRASVLTPSTQLKQLLKM